jgi:Lipocalin-like domain
MPLSEMGARMQSLAGTMWKLIEAFASDEAGSELPSPIGEHPMGFVMFEAERMIVAVVDGRLELPSNASSRAFAAYSGRYRFDGTDLVTSVDSASGPDLVGQQIRHVRFESPTRIVVTPKNKVLGRDAGLTFVWERVA